jgi:hypothetical protein
MKASGQRRRTDWLSKLLLLGYRGRVRGGFVTFPLSFILSQSSGQWVIDLYFDFL